MRRFSRFAVGSNRCLPMLQAPKMTSKMPPGDVTIGMLGIVADTKRGGEGAVQVDPKEQAPGFRATMSARSEQGPSMTEDYRYVSGVMSCSCSVYSAAEPFPHEKSQS